VYEWQGVRADGTFVEVNPAKLYVTTNAVGHFTKTKAMGNLVKDAGHGTSEVDAYAKAIFDAYNFKVDGPVLAGLKLWRREINVSYGQEVPKPFSADASEVIYTYWGAL
jgi:hypothetical protein